MIAYDWRFVAPASKLQLSCFSANPASLGQELAGRRDRQTDSVENSLSSKCRESRRIARDELACARIAWKSLCETSLRSRGPHSRSFGTAYLHLTILSLELYRSSIHRPLFYYKYCCPTNSSSTCSCLCLYTHGCIPTSSRIPHPLTRIACRPRTAHHRITAAVWTLSLCGRAGTEREACRY